MGNEQQQEYQLLRLLYTNCRSAKGKSTELSSLIIDYDIICLTETHIDNTINSRSILNRDDLIFYRKDRNLNGGGVLIAINNILQPKEIATNSNCEIIFVRIKSCITLCCYYRPNHGIDISSFTEAVNTVSDQYPSDHFILIGDMNFPGFDWSNDSIKSNIQYKSLHTEFRSFLFEKNLTQVIDTPTHVKGNTLDLVCTNNPSSISTNVIYPGISDHFLISISIRHCQPKPNHRIKVRKLYHKADVDKFQECLWETQCQLSKMSDVDEMWALFSSKLKSAVDASVPLKNSRTKIASQPFWFNKKANKLVSKHRKTYNKYKATGDPFFLSKYREERRNHKKELKNIERDYFVNKVCKPLETGNSKPFYHHLKWSQDTAKPPMKLMTTDKTHTEDIEECANILNQFFSAQFCTQHQLDSNSRMTIQQPTNLDTISISPDGVAKLLTSLKNGKSAGPDEICKDDLVVDPIMVSKCLSYIFEASLASSKLPQEWKLAHVTPLHKRGSSDQPNNYRPISLTSIPCKLLEHIVLHHLNIALDKILHNRQHGFRKGLSCETQLCATYHDIARCVDKGHTIHAVVMDFAKAFDKVPHRLLMAKLSEVPDISKQILDWIHDFLFNRKQRVVIKGKASRELPVTSGVPQGSVLGPTLFLAYINDLPKHVRCSISLFADDTLVYQIVDTKADKLNFQKNIDALHAWADTWGMSFNVSKCSVMLFNQTLKSPSSDYRLGNVPLDIVQQTKYLGVLLQSDLKFSNHICDKVNKANRQVGMIKRALHHAPETAKLLAYTSLCRPHVEYAASVWDPYLECLSHDIEMIQNKAVRFISNIKGRESVTEAREKLCLDTLVNRRKKIRHNLLLRLLSNEEHHRLLVNDYDELCSDNPDNTPTTRAMARGVPPTIYAKTSAYYNSFLPKTVREIKK